MINQPAIECSRSQLITQIYETYYLPVCNYIRVRTNNHYLAEDLAQDVFVRLLHYELMLRQETIQSFVFTIAKHILIDFLRRKNVRPEYDENGLENLTSPATDKTDSRILYKELFMLEKSTLSSYPTQCRKVYSMKRFEDLSCSEISHKLNISKRTVEVHLYNGRKKMRDSILKCV